MHVGLPDQASGLVPIVEPEVLLDGEHDIDRTLEVAEAIWAQTFKYMADNKVRLCPHVLGSAPCAAFVAAVSPRHWTAALLGPA